MLEWNLVFVNFNIRTVSMADWKVCYEKEIRNMLSSSLPSSSSNKSSSTPCPQNDHLLFFEYLCQKLT